MKINELLESARNAGTNLKDKATSAGNVLKEKAATAGQAAMDTTMVAMEKWLEEFPRIESYGLKVNNFTFNMSLNPSLLLELYGKHESFAPEKLTEIIAENKTTSLTGMVYRAIKSAYSLHEKVSSKKEGPLIVKIRLSLSPEISVFVGQPKVT